MTDLNRANAEYFRACDKLWNLWPHRHKTHYQGLSRHSMRHAIRHHCKVAKGWRDEIDRIHEAGRLAFERHHTEIE